MTVKRRLANLESSLSPTRAVLLWFENASRLGSISAYVHSCLAQADPQADLHRMDDQIFKFVCERHKGQGAREIERALSEAHRDACFLYELIVVLNGAEASFAQRTEVYLGALVRQLRSLVDDPFSFDAPLRRADRTEASRVDAAWRLWLANSKAIIRTVGVEEAARTQIDRRYFGGRSVLFPDVAEVWMRLQTWTGKVAALIEALPAPYRTRAGLQRRPQPTAPLQSFEDQALVRARDLIDAARITAFDRLGDRQAALRLAESHLRGS